MLEFRFHPYIPGPMVRGKRMKRKYMKELLWNFQYIWVKFVAKLNSFSDYFSSHSFKIFMKSYYFQLNKMEMLSFSHMLSIREIFS